MAGWPRGQRLDFGGDNKTQCRNIRKLVDDMYAEAFRMQVESSATNGEWVALSYQPNTYHLKGGAELASFIFSFAHGLEVSKGYEWVDQQPEPVRSALFREQEYGPTRFRIFRSWYVGPWGEELDVASSS